jgi:RNA polymerase sigma-70 factor (ECF subfamily)
MSPAGSAPTTQDLSDLQEKKPGAWQLFYQHFGRNLLRYLQSCSVPQAEDVLQEVFLSLFQQAHQLRDLAGVKPWLYAVARRKSAQTFRQTLAEVTLEDAESTLPAASPQSLDHLALRHLLKQMDEPFRSTLILFYWEGFGVEEIARMMEVETATVKSRLFRGRKLLKTQLGQTTPKATQPLSSEIHRHTLSMILRRCWIGWQTLVPYPCCAGGAP